MEYLAQNIKGKLTRNIQQRRFDDAETGKCWLGILDFEHISGCKAPVATGRKCPGIAVRATICGFGREDSGNRSG